MNSAQRLEIFKRLSIAIPNPTTELRHNSTFELLIAVILSAQATDKGVNIATEKLYAVANTPEAILALGVEGLEAYIKTIGLYRSKAKNVIATCRILVEQHQSQVPNTRLALEALPGVGRKTANVILNTAFGEPTIAVDTHLFRLGNRIKLATGKTVLEVEQKYLKTIPLQYMKDAHHLLILHGRYVCTARRPKCAQCCIEDLCEYNAKEYDLSNTQVNPMPTYTQGRPQNRALDQSQDQTQEQTQDPHLNLPQELMQKSIQDQA